MKTLLRAASAALVLIALLALPTSSAFGQSAGDIPFAKPAESNFDVFTKSPTTAQQQWMRDHYSRMRTYAPYFDSRLSWFSNAWSYEGAYNIYKGNESGPLDQYVLRDAAGNRLYIPFACSNGSCTQYAADIGDPGWRRHYIDIAKARIAKGYKGIFVDDVNLAFKVSNGNGSFVAPIDERTGQTMTLDSWQRYFAEFMEQLRAELPSHVEIVHNQVYFHAGLANTYVRRAIEAASHIEIERGVIDTGIVGGTGTYGYETVLKWAEYIHSRGKGVIWDAQSSWGREYQIATHFLVSNGLDGLAHPDGANPDNWWSGYDTELGEPLGARYSWNGVFRRDFERGIVLVNQPGQTTKSLSLGNSFKTLAGTSVTSVSLPAREGQVLLRDAPVPPPSDTTPPETTITGGPLGEVVNTVASVTFTADEAGGSFECSLDGGAWAACSSPHELTGLSLGEHTLAVRAKDAAGNVDATPASRSWTVAAPALTPAPAPTPTDTVAPDTGLTGGPGTSTTSTSTSFGLTSTEAGSTFECRLDGGAWAPCSSPKALSGLAVGTHTFEARARDSAGNVDATPASRTWTVAVRNPQRRNVKSSVAVSTTSTSSTVLTRDVLVKGRAKMRRARASRGRSRRVRIALQRRVNGRWVTVKRRLARVRSNGRFSVTFAGMPNGQYRARPAAARSWRLSVSLRNRTA